MYLQKSFKKQLVISFKGIRQSNVNDVYTYLFKNKGETINAIHAVRQAMKAVQETGSISLTFIGHSIGGSRATLAFLLFKKKQIFPNLRIKTVTFDTPGIEYVAKLETYNPTDFDQLDIVNYLSSPNFINTYNGLQIGINYRVVFERFATSHFRYLLESHLLDNFIKAFDKETGEAKKSYHMKAWPTRKNYKEFFKWANQSNNYDPILQDLEPHQQDYLSLIYDYNPL